MLSFTDFQYLYLYLVMDHWIFSSTVLFQSHNVLRCQLIDRLTDNELL